LAEHLFSGQYSRYNPLIPLIPVPHSFIPVLLLVFHPSLLNTSIKNTVALPCYHIP
jgi:hypothetical protein